MSMAACRSAVHHFFLTLRRIIEPVIGANFAEFERICKDESLVDNEDELPIIFALEFQTNGLKRLFDTYPVLGELAASSFEWWLANSRDLLNRLADDHAAIEACVKLSLSSPIAIENIQYGLGDAHNRHKAVARIGFCNGASLVYKPRSLDGEKTFYDFVTKLQGAGLAERLYIPGIVACGDYGWMEAIEPLQDLDGVARPDLAARQFGVLAALWYVLGGTDLYNENVVFGMNGPVIIDAETIFGCDFISDSYHDRRGLEPCIAFDAISSLIAGSGAFHAWSIDNESNPLLISGFSRFQEIFKHSAAKRANGDESVYTKNVTVAGLSWKDVVRAVEEGIRHVLQYVQTTDYDKFCSVIKECFCGSVTRFVARPTGFYGQYLSEMIRRFDLWTDSTALASHALASVQSSPVAHFDRDLVSIDSQDADQLIRYDIPYYGRKLGENTIIGPKGAVPLKNELDFVSCFARKIALCASEVEFQLVAIRSMLAFPFEQEKYVRSSVGEGTLITRSMAFEIAQAGSLDIDRYVTRIAAYVQGAVAERSDIWNSYYLRQVSTADFASLNEYGYGMYLGYIGRLIFLGAYGHLKNDAATSKLVAKRVQGLRDYFVNNAKKVQYEYGFGRGIQSLLYGFHVLRQFGHQIEVSDALEDLFQRIAGIYAGKGRRLDLIDGLSGDMMLLDIYAEMMSRDTVLRMCDIFKCEVEKYLQRWQDINDERRKVGLAHGALGSALAASTLFKRFKDQNMKDIAIELLEREIEYVDSLGMHAALGRQNVSWCYGLAGRAIAYKKMSENLDLSALDSLARRTIAEAQDVEAKDFSVCCGLSGLMMASVYVNGWCEEARFVDLFHRTKIADSEAKYDSSLFKGVSGVGYMFLYATYLGRAPLFLAFE